MSSIQVGHSSSQPVDTPQALVSLRQRDGGRITDLVGGDCILLHYEGDVKGWKDDIRILQGAKSPDKLQEDNAQMIASTLLSYGTTKADRRKGDCRYPLNASDVTEQLHRHITFGSEVANACGWYGICTRLDMTT